jgi:hypothetical protein
VATLVGVVALNALSVSRWVRQGRPVRPWVVRVGDFPGVKASHRAGLVRVRTQSRVPRLHTYVVLARRTCAGRALAWFFKGFAVWIPRGFVPFSRWFWVPLV